MPRCLNTPQAQTAKTRIGSKTWRHYAQVNNLRMCSSQFTDRPSN